jgi:hypothetical protein
LEIIKHIKVASGRRSQVVVAAVKGHDGSEIDSFRKVESFVLKLFDPIYSDEDLCATQSEWGDRVGFTERSCDAEIKAYEALSELQGTLVPTCFGIAVHTIDSEARTRRKAHHVQVILLQHLDVKTFAVGHGLSKEEKNAFRGRRGDHIARNSQTWRFSP